MQKSAKKKKKKQSNLDENMIVSMDADDDEGGEPRTDPNPFADWTTTGA